MYFCLNHFHFLIIINYHCDHLKTVQIDGIKCGSVTWPKQHIQEPKELKLVYTRSIEL